MKVYIGPYKNYIGPYQLTKWMQLFGMSEDRQQSIASWLCNTWFGDFCLWIDNKRKRTVKVKIDYYDSWSVDATLSPIIHPLLIQLKEKSNGFFHVDNEDAPEKWATDPENYFSNVEESYEKRLKKYEYVMDEMIWAFSQLLPDYDYEAQFHTGEHDIIWEKTPDDSELLEMKKGPNDTHVCDYDGLKKHEERMSNGFRLFGKYYRALWD